MKIVINIEADSVEEAKEACQKLGAPITGVYTVTGTEAKLHIEELTKQGHFGDTSPEKTLEPAKTRTRATTKVETPAVVPVPTPEVTPTPNPLDTPTVDVLATPASTPHPLDSPSVNPLDTPAPAVDILTTPTPVAKDTTITLQTVRDKIGTMTDKRAAVMDLVRTYKKADGQPAEKPGELQEKDYADVLVALNLLG